MKQFLFIFSFTIVSVLSLGQTRNNMNQIPPKLPLKDFFKNPGKVSYTLSPNGEYFAYKMPYKDRQNVFVQKVGDKKATRITSVTDRDIAGYFWATNNRILYIKDNGGNENFQLFGVDIDGKNFKALTDFEGVRTQIIDKLEEQEDEIIIGLNKNNPQVFDPYRLNIVSGEMTQIATNPGNISGWMTDHNGKLRIAYATDGVNTTLLYRATERDEFQPLVQTNFKESLSPQAFTFDNKNLYAISNLGRDKAVAVIFDIESKKETEILYEHPEVDVSHISFSKKRKVPTAVIYNTWKYDAHFLDSIAKQRRERLKQEFGDIEAYVTASNKDESKFIIHTHSDVSRGAYYFYDESSDEFTLLESIAPWLKAEQMCEMKPIEYTSRDGLSIHGYLTLPKGRDPKNLPVVVNPHGGPWHRDSWGFNPEIQFLANRGYAVLQMNFRGSTGYGRAFWEASFKQWGLKMQDDITDGVNWLIEKGIADPKRIAIYGGSYGGYATLAGLTQTPDLYTCAIDYVGVSNLFSFMKTIPPYWKPYLEMMYEMVGDPEKDSLQLTQTSPALNADKIKAPLFIAQGANDPRVNKDESDQMVKALEARGVKVQYMVKDNEGHGFHNEENKYEFYGAMEKFLEKYLN